MAKFNSVFVATVQYALGFYIFKKPELAGCGPLVASMVVLFAMSLVLWSLPLYPRRLRKLVWIGNGLAQYLLAVFCIEYIMGCFWFPLESAVLALLPMMAVTIEDILLSYEYHVPLDFLKQEVTGIGVSYFLSFLILIAAAHATRVINLGLLSGGPTPFIRDVIRRMKKFFANLAAILGIPRPRSKRSSRKSDYCASDDEGLDEVDYYPPDVPDGAACTPTSGSEYSFR